MKFKNLWKMYERFQKASNKEKYDFPFPMAVFGTLRKDYSNSCLMRNRNVECLAHSKAFITHMIPSGLWLDFKKDATGVAEVYFYDKLNWKSMIRSVDGLEGFNKHSDSNYGYNRTLVRIHLLPKDFKSNFYGKNSILYSDRDFGILESCWEQYVSIPAWIYANTETNVNCLKLKNHPILWFKE